MLPALAALAGLAALVLAPGVVVRGRGLVPWHWSVEVGDVVELPVTAWGRPGRVAVRVESTEEPIARGAPGWRQARVYRGRVVWLQRFSVAMPAPFLGAPREGARVEFRSSDVTTAL